MKRVLGVSFLIFLLFLYFIMTRKIIFFSLGIGLLFYAVLYLHRKVDLPERRFFYFVIFLSVILAIFFGKSEISRVEGIERYISNKKYIEVEGKVDSIEKTKKGYRIRLNDAKEKRKFGSVYLYVDEVHVQTGDRVLASGKPKLFRDVKNEGGYDEKHNMYGLGIMFSMINQKIRVLERPYFSMNRSLFAFRERLSNAIKNNLPKEEGELICAMMVGEKGTGLNVVKELFRLAGMLALLTISGTHISVIANSVKDLLRKMGFSFITCAYASSVVSLLYTIMCGSDVSAKRAFLCFVLSMIGLVFGEAYDSLNGLSVVGFILLIDKPYLCLNSSFVLSFGIVFGVVGISIPAKKQIFERLRSKWKKRYHQTKKEKFRLKAWERLYIYFISVLLIQLFAIPIVSYFFYEIPTYSCFVNMMLLPLFPVMLGLSLMGGVLLCIGEKVLSFIFIYIVHLLIYFYEYVADISTKLPISRVIVGKPSWLVLLIYYVVLIVLFADFYRFKRIHKVFGVVCIMLLLLLPKQNEFTVNMLYVGQGDGIHIHLSRSVDLFVDGGSTSEQEVGKYTIIPYLKSKGIRDIDMWMVTHPDLDHISGLIELLEEGYEIKEIVTSKEVYDSDAFSEVLNKASQNGTKIHLVSDGTIMEFDAGTISFFWPKSGFTSDDMNDLSLGFVLKYKDFSATFTGDMSGEIEKENLNKVKECTLFKSSHHGSNMSNSKELLEVLQPEVIIISAGEKNRYGHPGKNALDRMRIYTPNIYCTKWNGQITVFGDGNVKTLLDKPI